MLCPALQGVDYKRVYKPDSHSQECVCECSGLVFCIGYHWGSLHSILECLGSGEPSTSDSSFLLPGTQGGTS